MKYQRFLAIVLLFAALLAQGSTPVSAQEARAKGLTISPVRHELTVKTGAATSGSFIVTNETEKPMVVNLSILQFSVADYTYDYKFRSPDNDWVKIRQDQVQLAPGKSQKIFYDVTIPGKATPGGYYYSLFASTTLEGAGLPGTVRATSLLYMKVGGALVRTSVLRNESLPFWVTGSEIPYKFDVENTGNVHFSAYFYGRVNGLFGEHPEFGTSHLLMPGAVRTIGGSIPSPILPGIYTVTYGYKVDFANIETTKTSYILYLPPWSFAGVLLIALAVRWYIQQREASAKNQTRK